jgi:hypothetical protein
MVERRAGNGGLSMETFILLGGFVSIEVVFTHCERLIEKHEHHIRAVKHASLITWLIHPGFVSGIEHWTIHVMSNAIYLLH